MFPFEVSYELRLVKYYSCPTIIKTKTRDELSKIAKQMFVLHRMMLCHLFCFFLIFFYDLLSSTCVLSGKQVHEIFLKAPPSSSFPDLCFYNSLSTLFAMLNYMYGAYFFRFFLGM